MGENERLWFPIIHIAGQPMCDDVVFRAEQELDRIKKEALLEANAHRPPFELPTWTAKYEDGRWYVVNSVTGEEELIENQEDFDKAFPKQCATQVCSNDEFGKTSQRKARKHYKPKFTL